MEPIGRGEQEFRNARDWLQGEHVDEPVGDPVVEPVDPVDPEVGFPDLPVLHPDYESSITIDENIVLWDQLLNHLRQNITQRGDYRYPIHLEIHYTIDPVITLNEGIDAFLAFPLRTLTGPPKNIVQIDVYVRFYTLNITGIGDITLPGMFYDFETTYLQIIDEINKRYRCTHGVTITVTNTSSKKIKKIDSNTRSGNQVQPGDIIVATQGTADDPFMEAFKSPNAKAVFTHQVKQGSSAALYAPEPCATTRYGCCQGDFPINLIPKLDEAGSNCHPDTTVNGGRKTRRNQKTRRKRKKQQKTRR